MKQSAFDDFSEGVLEVSYEAWDFKTCKRSDGTTYGVPDSSSCAQKGAREVKASKKQSGFDDSNLAGKLGMEIAQIASGISREDFYAIRDAYNRADALKVKAVRLYDKGGKADMPEAARLFQQMHAEAGKAIERFNSLPAGTSGENYEVAKKAARKAASHQRKARHDIRLAAQYGGFTAPSLTDTKVGSGSSRRGGSSSRRGGGGSSNSNINPLMQNAIRQSNIRKWRWKDGKYRAKFGGHNNKTHVYDTYDQMTRAGGTPLPPGSSWR